MEETSGFPGGSGVNNPPAITGDRFDPWIGKIPWRRAWQSTPVFLSGESHGQRNLVGYSPWGSQSVTKHTHTHTEVQFPFLIKTKLFLGWGGAVGQQRARRWQCLLREGWWAPTTGRVTQACSPLRPLALIPAPQAWPADGLPTR